MKDIVKITADIISLDEIAKAVADPKAGAISTFSGTTRDNFEGILCAMFSCFFYFILFPAHLTILVDRAGTEWAVFAFHAFESRQLRMVVNWNRNKQQKHSKLTTIPPSLLHLLHHLLLHLLFFFLSLLKQTKKSRP